MSKFTFRPARPGDEALILQLIQGLAEFEKLSHQVVATTQKLRESLFGEGPVAYAIIAQIENAPAGLAIYFFNYSTFLAQKGLYLEDLFVLPQFRSHGLGRAFFAHLAQVAVQTGCGRMEWSVLDWNTEAIKFYQRIGATPMNDWTVFRLDAKFIQELSKES